MALRSPACASGSRAITVGAHGSFTVLAADTPVIRRAGTWCAAASDSVMHPTWKKRPVNPKP
ncbi:hypothetical protein GCM10010442_33840 [Kitasatospora kifunensis]